MTGELSAGRRRDCSVERGVATSRGVRGGYERNRQDVVKGVFACPA